MEQVPALEPSGGPVRIERWPSELPLRVAVILASLGLWFLLAVSLIGIVYALLIGLFLFLAHVGFVAHVRGSGVRLGPDQLPGLHARVEALARRAGLARVPEAYLMQAGGSLNALATRFLGSGLIVLFSDLVDACGDDEAACDMIVGHELGHLAAGHLAARWFLLPGLVTPFLGSAYSQACEYTCDRYGAALCGERRAALTGLGILAAGGAHGRALDFAALARQREALNTGWMTLGRWLMSHPPLCLRFAALDPSLVEGTRPGARGPVRAVAILAAFALLPAVALAAFGVVFVGRFQEALREAQAGVRAPMRELDRVPPFRPPGDTVAAAEQARSDLRALARLVLAVQEETGRLPDEEGELAEAWRARRRSDPPVDPFDGLQYGYAIESAGFVVWSSGPDGQSGNDDDIEVRPADLAR